MAVKQTKHNILQVSQRIVQALGMSRSRHCIVLHKLTESDISNTIPSGLTSCNFKYKEQYITQESAFFAAIMAASLEMVAEKKAILVDLLTSEMQTLLLHVGTRRITSHELDLIHSLLCSMSPSYDLKDAIFYLETYDWDLTTARLQYTFDDVD